MVALPPWSPCPHGRPAHGRVTTNIDVAKPHDDELNFDSTNDIHHSFIIS
jgi:hypothetical protein